MMDYIESRNPADHFRIIGKVKISNPDEVKDCARKSRIASEAWKNIEISQRVEAIKGLVGQMENNKEELSCLITSEVGKTITEAREEVKLTIEETKHFLQKGPEYIRPNVIEEDEAKKTFTTWEPWGVAAVITPWNFPLEISVWGIVPNLICGNTVIYKPSENASLTGMKLAGYMKSLDLPENVFQAVYGGKDVGEKLIGQEIDLIWLTGSRNAGQKAYEKAGKKFIKSLMELGGSSPGIVFGDIKVTDQLIDRLYMTRFYNCGQVCSAVKRLYVHRDLYEEVVEKMVKKVKSVRVGDPYKPDTQMGSIVSLQQLEILESQVDDSIKKGAKIEIGGKRIEILNGAFYEPTILTNLTHDMRVLSEETFGPVLPIIPFTSEEEVIQMANDSEYGLSAEIYCKDYDKAIHIGKKIMAGRICINGGNASGINCPFGGFKKSGIGREHGAWGFYEMSQLKSIVINK